MEEIRCTCFMCGKSYEYGLGKYNGKYIRDYDINVCTPCWNANWDGWNPRYEQKLEKHLKAKGLTIPERNSPSISFD